MREAGLSIAGQTSKGIDSFVNKPPFDHIIIVCQDGEAECPGLIPLALDMERWPLTDPAGVTGDPDTVIGAFRRTREDLKERIGSWLARQAAPEKPV